MNCRIIIVGTNTPCLKAEPHALCYAKKKTLEQDANVLERFSGSGEDCLVRILGEFVMCFYVMIIIH